MEEVQTQKPFFEHTPGLSSGEESLPFLSARNIVKKFPGTLALDKVSIDIYPREIHALLGENGAGKSTLVKIFYGIYIPDEGDIFIQGKKVQITYPRDAIKYGISLVSQTPQIIERLTISENIILGLTKYGLISRIKNIHKYLIEEGEKLGIKIDPETEVWKLSYTQKQLVELLRAVILGAKVIILDEAITFLPLIEKKKFYKFMREFTSKGGAVILITHKIPEAIEAADRITVLRKGKVIGTVPKKEATIESIRKMMFGERVNEITYERLPLSQPLNETLLEVKDVWVYGDYGVYAVQGVSLKLRPGEVIGIAGVAGNGQLELIQSVIGLRKVDKGRIFIKSNGELEDITNKGTGRIRSLGVGYIPDEPLKFGVSMDNTIEENLAMLPTISKRIIRWRRIAELAKKLIDEYRIVTPSSRTQVKLLSGGNLMKVLVSRELEVSKKMLIAYNPTRALDEVTAIMVRKVIKSKAIKKKIGVLFASEDLDEVMQLSDTIMVMNSGKIVGVFPAEKAVREEIERLMVM